MSNSIDRNLELLRAAQAVLVSTEIYFPINSLLQVEPQDIVRLRAAIAAIEGRREL